MSNSFVTPWTVACLAPLSMGFPRQEYWSGLLLPSPGDLPDPGIKSTSLALAGRFFTTEDGGDCDLQKVFPFSVSLNEILNGSHEAQRYFW